MITNNKEDTVRLLTEGGDIQRKTPAKDLVALRAIAAVSGKSKEERDPTAPFDTRIERELALADLTELEIQKVQEYLGKKEVLNTQLKEAQEHIGNDTKQYIETMKRLEDPAFTTDQKLALKRELEAQYSNSTASYTASVRQNLLGQKTPEKKAVIPPPVPEKKLVSGNGTQLPSGSTDARVEQVKITPDTFEGYAEILAIVKKIPGLEGVTSLSAIGFTITASGDLMPPDGLDFTDNVDSYDIVLDSDYEVVGGKIQEKKASGIVLGKVPDTNDALLLQNKKDIVVALRK